MGYDVEHTVWLAELLAKTAKVGMQDFSRLIHLCHYALESQRLEGDIVEFGCFEGDTAKLLTAITNKKVWLYDSFQGLPANTESCTPGAMTAKQDRVLENFRQELLPLPAIHAGWFSDVLPGDLPAKIALAHLDGDLYSSTLQALCLVYDRMVKGGVIMVDDYEEPFFPGPKRAVEAFLRGRPEQVLVLRGLCGEKACKAAIVKC